jgi:type IV pilus assembly protein PilF
LAQLQKEQGNYGEAKKSLWKYDRVTRVSSESLWLSYEIAQGLGDTKAALGYGELMKSMFPEHPNTALFKKQMGKFQPVATVKNKRRESMQSTEPSVSQPEENTAVETTQTVLAESPALMKVNKTLTPEILAEVPNAVAEKAVDKQVELLESASTGVTNTNDGLSADAAKKREAELEAALAADFNNTENESATIDGAAVRVNDSLATVDDAVEVTADEAQDTVTQKIDEAEDGNASYHVVLPKENLYRISLRYNVKMKYLMQWNNLDDPSAITIGMKLRVKDPKNND